MSIVRCYEGRLGRGKTLNMVYDLMPAIAKGVPVISNTPIQFCTSKKFLVKKCTSQTPDHRENKEHCFANACIYGAEHKKAIYFSDMSKFLWALLNIKRGIVAIDEAGIVLHKKFSSIPVNIFIKAIQSRKAGVSFYFTAQSFKMLEPTFKLIVDEVGQCGKYYPFYFDLPKINLFAKKKFSKTDGRVFTTRFVEPTFINRNLSASKRGTGWQYIIRYRKLYPSTFLWVMNSYDTLHIVNMMPVGFREKAQKYINQDEKPLPTEALELTQ